MFLFIACKCHSLWTKCWGMSLTLISKLMEREGTFQRGGKIFGEISGHWFSLDLSLNISSEEKGCIEYKVVKEENKWSGLGSRRKTINIKLYDIIFQLRKLGKVVRSYSNKSKLHK